MSIPMDEDGAIGATSYIKFPFAGTVAGQGWNSSPYLAPGQLFYSVNPDSIFNKPNQMREATYAAIDALSKEFVPFMGAQLWATTVISSLPAGTIVKDESKYPWIINDRAAGTATAKTADADKAYAAWARWILDRFPKYGAMMYDGGPIESNPQVRADGAISYHISMAMPLDPKDIPSDLVPSHIGAVTYGDLFAYQYGKIAKLTANIGFAPSDYVDSNPYSATYADFNPRIVNLFASTYNYNIPPGSVKERARWIIDNVASNWIDFHCMMFARFFNAVSTEISRATHNPALIYDQCGGWAHQRRMSGLDARILAKNMNGKNYLAIWDCKTIQSDRGGPLVHHPVCGLAGPVVAAAREPLVRNMANIEAIDNDYWQALASFYPSLSASDRTEIGNKLVKQIWISYAWAHICGYDGDVRRALCGASRDYWDGGTLAELDPLTSLMTSIYPVRPWGAALYYSVNAERALEHEQIAGKPLGSDMSWLLPTDELASILNSGQAPIGYFISDAALSKGNLRKGYAAAPSAFLIPSRLDLIPASEKAVLQAIAPVVTSPAELGALRNQPIRFKGGLCGFAFVAQDGRLMIVIRNPSVQPKAMAIDGTVHLSGLKPGSYPVKDLETGSHVPITVATDGTCSFNWTVQRWDTQALSLPAEAVPAVA